TGSRIILLILNDASGNPVKTTFANFSGAASAAYRFDGIPNGTYALVTQDFSLPQSFGAKPIIVNVAGAAVTQDIQLVQTGIIKGKMAVQQTLAGSTTAQVTLVTDANETQLPQELQVYAQANPFFLGGQVNALTGGGASSTGTGGTSGSSSRPKLDSTGRFEIDGLLPGVYDVHFQAPNDSSDNSSLRLVSSMVPAVTVTGGQTTDIGTFNLTAADQIQGAVADAATKAPLANIPMLARPAATQSQDYDTIAAVTDVNGKYTLVGLDPAVKLYDIIANMAQQGGSQITPPYESQTALAVDVTSTAVVDFALKPARLSISGRIVGAPGGPPLRQPFSSSVEAPPLGAIVFVQKSGVPPRDNPLGDTQIATDVQGRFTIPSLTTGTYNLTMVALGHASVAQSISVSTGPIDIGTIQLKLGGTLSGALSKPDGSNPGASELSDVLAVTNDFSQVLAATLTYDPNTRTYTNYSISGFLPGSVYRVLLLGGTSSVPVSPPEVQHIVFSSAEQSMTQDIVMRPAPPFVLARARRAANGQFAVTFDLSQPLRQKTAADDDLAAVLSTYSAAGALSRIQLNAARFELSAVYTPAVGESSFTLLLSGHSNQTDPDSIDPVNPEFVYHSTFGFYTGLDGYYSNTISNTNGGTLLIDGDAGRVTIPGGAFQIETSSSIPVSLAVSREALSQAATSGLRGAAANLSALRFHGGAYPPGLLAAVAATPPQVNPLSGFYNILLPLGVRTALSKPVQMTVAYSTGTDPTKLNLYWYNAAANAYVLQQDVTGAAPVIDYANHTISVNVNHFSTFVLFNADVSVITGNAFSGEFAAYNFPNPFDLSVKTVSTIHGAGKQTVRGTMISVALPSDVSGDGSVRIYNVAGERVRTLDLGTLRAGQYVYQAWDGRNDSGRDVASGVYIAQVRVGNQSRFFKMALIK
ncbi:MAG: hypothetical protein KGK30_00310, partial [Elusimicrobia bacterium]|nr:hypothetical protein [Elusimicrobiota bacterium]